MATKKTSVSPEFLYIPVGNIVVLEQVRSNINIETDSFKSLMQSIKDKGILEPLLVTGQDGISYTLLCGERRLAAARQLGLESVPVRVIEAGKESGETIAFQLTENLQREDLKVFRRLGFSTHWVPGGTSEAVLKLKEQGTPGE